MNDMVNTPAAVGGPRCFQVCRQVHQCLKRRVKLSIIGLCRNTAQVLGRLLSLQIIFNIGDRLPTDEQVRATYLVYNWLTETNRRSHYILMAFCPWWPFQLC